VRAAHAEQLAQAQRSADERVTTLTEALALAREAAETYRPQLEKASASSQRRTPPSKRSH
jgi:hypothetical protein